MTIPIWKFIFLEWMDLGSPVDSTCPDCGSRSFFVGVRIIDNLLATYYAHCGRCSFTLDIDRELDVQGFDLSHFLDTL